MSVNDKITLNPFTYWHFFSIIFYSISDKLKEEVPKLNSIRIIEDANVSADGTIVETPLSRVDCRLKTQIDQIAEKMMSEHYSTIEVPNLEYCDHILTSDEYDPKLIGAKAVNLKKLEKLADEGKIDVNIPKSVALPAGYIEKLIEK